MAFRKETVADIIVRTLDQVGVKRIYGVVGDSLNSITESLLHQKQIEWVHTRHEEAAAFAAGAEAQLTQKLAVCAGSCGPGNLHLINGLYDCQRNGVPVLAIAAHIPSQEIGSQYFQETHPEFLFKECSVFCELVSNPHQMPRMLDMAIQTALTKKGVAVLVIPGDVALREAVITKINNLAGFHQPRVIPQDNELLEMATLINQAEKVTLLCGSGCANAREELFAISNIIQSPQVHTLRGKQFLEYDNPYDVGMTGFIGFSSGYYAIEDCDLLLMLGTDFPYRQFYPSHAKIIQVDLDGSHLGRRHPVDLGVIGDVKETLNALLPLLKPKMPAFLNKALDHYKEARKDLDTLAKKTTQQSTHPQYLTALIDRYAAEDAVFSCDVGTPTVWSARYLKMNGKRRLVGSFNHGSMANALSQCIGAQATFRDRQVIALCGDGGFAMLMGELLTLTQVNLPIKVFVFNNGTLGFVELEMKAAGFLEFGTELKNPNFASMAKAIGIESYRIEEPLDLEEAIQKGLSSPGPVVFDVVINRMELIIPPKITLEHMKGFSLYLSKAIINGRGTEVVELLKSNLWR